jgi:hypothetical protein
MAALAGKIGYDPVLLPLLQVVDAQGSQFGPAQPALLPKMPMRLGWYVFNNSL